MPNQYQTVSQQRDGLCVSKTEEDDYEDMVQMDQLTPSTILDNVQRRYRKNSIYTNVSSILIAVNPYQQIQDMYSEKTIHKYYTQETSLPPHIFTVARAAYLSALGKGVGVGGIPKPQSILIAGESGSGKTEATKQILSFLTTVSRQSSMDSPSSTLSSSFSAAVSSAITHNIEHQLLAANPILEAFGNAKTLRNDNSSRFGKWIQLTLHSQAGSIIAGRIEHYLLETTRIVKQSTGERNYNIFYQLCANKQLQASTFMYLNQSGCYEINGVNDAHMYQSVLHAFNILNFSTQQQTQIMNIVLGILYLGNIQFSAVHKPGGKEGCEIPSTCSSAVVTAATLLGWPIQLLQNFLTIRILISPRSTIINMPRSVKEAVDNRDSLAKTLYSTLVSYIIHHINQTIHSTSTQSTTSTTTINTSAKTVTIGILDIFGFECFPMNQFEQLCINFANEKLHQHFLSYVFKQELSLYQQEGLTGLHSLSFRDNQSTIELLEKKPYGVFPMLAEELSVPKGNDMSLLQKLHTHQHTHPSYSHPKVQGASVFSIQHYAGMVEYQMTGICDKNRQKVAEQTSSLLEASQIKVIRAMIRLQQYGTEAVLEEEEEEEEEEGREGAGQAEAKQSTTTATTAAWKKDGMSTRGKLADLPIQNRVVDRNATRSLPASHHASRAGSLTKNALSSASPSTSSGQASPPTTTSPATTSSPTTSPSTSRTTMNSVSATFQQSLSDLLHSISLTHSHFIRCIKPNAEKQAWTFDEELVLTQLQSNGVIDAVAVRKQGYSERMKIPEFVRRYGILLYTQQQKHHNKRHNKQKQHSKAVNNGANAADDRAAVIAIMQQVSILAEKENNKKKTEIGLWALGLTRVFYRQCIHLALEQQFERHASTAAVTIQKYVRGWLIRRKMKTILTTWSRIRAALATGKLDVIDAAITQTKTSPGALPLPEHVLQRCKQQRQQLSVGESAQRDLLQALTMNNASLQDRIHLLNTSIAIAKTVKPALYPTWYPALSRLLELTQSGITLLTTASSNLQQLMQTASHNQNITAQLQQWIVTYNNTLTPWLQQMKRVVLGQRQREMMNVWANVSLLSEVSTAQQMVLQYTQCHEQLQAAIQSKDRVVLREVLQQAEKLSLQWSDVSIARIHLEALDLIHEVDTAIAEWEEAGIEAVIKKLKSLAAQSTTAASINGCLPTPLTLASMMDTCEASLVACRNEHEAASTAKKTLSQHSQDKRKLLFALQLAEDAMYMTHHSRRSTLGREIDKRTPQPNTPSMKQATMTTSSLPALVTELRAQCSRLESVQKQAAEQEAKVEAAHHALKQAQVESATEDQIVAAIKLAEQAALNTEIIAQAKSHLLTVQTIAVLNQAIHTREFFSLQSAVDITQLRLKQQQLDVRSVVFTECYHKAKGLLQMLMNVSTVNALVEDKVRRLTVERDVRQRQRSSAQPPPPVVIQEEMKKEENDWQTVIDELKQAIRKARLTGAKDGDLKQALEIVNKHEEEVESRRASVETGTGGAQGTSNGPSVVVLESGTTLSAPLSFVSPTKSRPPLPVKALGVRVLPPISTPSRPAVSQSGCVDAPSGALKTPLSTDDSVTAATIQKIQQSHQTEMAAKRRIDLELQAQEEVAETVHRQSVVALGGPTVEYEESPNPSQKINNNVNNATGSVNQSCPSVSSSSSPRVSYSSDVNLNRLVRVSQENWTFNVHDLEKSTVGVVPLETDVETVKKGEVSVPKVPRHVAANESLCCRCVIS